MVFAAFLIYSLLSPGLITFLLKINYIFSLFTLGWLTVNPIFKFCFKKNTSKYRGELMGIPTTRIFLFIDNKGKSINIGNLD